VGMNISEDPFSQQMGGLYNASIENKESKTANYSFMLVFVIGLIISYLFFPLMLLLGWNYGLAAIFGLVKVNYLQAVLSVIFIHFLKLTIVGYKPGG
jgi:hypothetical protein